MGEKKNALGSRRQVGKRDADIGRHRSASTCQYKATPEVDGSVATSCLSIVRDASTLPTPLLQPTNSANTEPSQPARERWSY